MQQNNVAPNVGQNLTSNQCPITLGAELYPTCRGERVLVVIRFKATFLPLRPCCEKYVAYLFLERCRKSSNVWLHALVQSGCLHSSLFFEHYKPHCTLRLSARTLQCLHATILSFFTWRWPGLDSVSYSRCSVVPSVMG